MVDKFVSVKAIKRKLNYVFRSNGVVKCVRNDILEAFNRVKDTDVVEIVRCKDCMHHRNCAIENAGMFGDECFCISGEVKEG